MKFPYLKMEGLGNDFVVLDGREHEVPLLDWAKLADRQQGIGCDQVILLEPSDRADVKMRIINADGSEVEACGNATRCVGWLLDKPEGSIETVAGVLKIRIVREHEARSGGRVSHELAKQRAIEAPVGAPGRNQKALVEVDMGEPVIIDRELPIEGDPVEISVGNPHLVFFKTEIDDIDLEAFGKPMEHHEAFPGRTNVEVVEVLAPDHLKMRVWERGAGITQACGTGACAVAAAARYRGVTDEKVQVEMPGGSLWISWKGEGSSLLMEGAVSLIERAELDVDKYEPFA